MHRLLIGLDPDLTILIDIDPSVAAARDGSVKGGETRFEERGNLFMSGVADRLRARAAAEPDRFLVLDGDGLAELISDRVLRAILDRGPEVTTAMSSPISGPILGPISGM